MKILVFQPATTITLFLMSLVSAVSAFVARSHRPSCTGCRSRSPTTTLLLAVNTPNNNSNIPSFITSPVLRQLYPELMQYKETYGHVNIPLGSTPGRQCQTLRRLHIQNKLTPDEVQLLTDLNFRFSSLEDVYYETDFDDMLQRLLRYEQGHANQYQVPKKYPPDPELGAWVTGLRRLGASNVQPDHAQQLDAIRFTWTSSRQCGSQFMQQYRDVADQVAQQGLQATLEQGDIQQWVAAQRKARQRQALSDTRLHYLQQLLGPEWYQEPS
jgi:hypothetical protein